MSVTYMYATYFMAFIYIIKKKFLKTFTMEKLCIYNNNPKNLCYSLVRKNLELDYTGKNKLSTATVGL